MWHEYLVFAIIAVTLALFIWGKWRYDIVALLALAATTFVGAIPFNHVFSGFSNPAVITVAAVMVITEAIASSGLISQAVNRLAPATNVSVIAHIGLLSCIAGVLSAFMNNVAALGLIMPLAMQTAYKSNRAPALILMPIAFASILGGMTTLIGTPPNLLVAAIREEWVGKPFGMFSFAPVGVILAIIGIIFIIFVGWRLIPKARLTAAKQVDFFKIKEYVTEAVVTEGSSWIGSSIRDLETIEDADFMVLGLIRDNRKRLNPPQGEIIQQDDILILEAHHKELEKLLGSAKLRLVGEEQISEDVLSSDDVSVIEAVVVPGSTIEGRTTQRLKLHSRYRINLLAISRQGRPFRQRIKNVKLSAGDVLLLQGKAETLSDTIAEIGFLPLAERGLRIGVEQRMFLPILIFLTAIILTTVHILPVQISFAGAVLAMVLLNLIPIRRVYQSIDWSIIVLLAAMIPVGEALEITGGTHLLAGKIAAMAAQVSPYIILAIVVFITMSLSDVMNNAATAVVMGPLAASLAKSLGYNLDPFLMAVAVGASCAFLTPIGHQNNTLILGPGGYRFGDYWRMGLPLEILILIISVPLIVFIWPL